MKLSEDQKKILIGLLAGLGGAIVGYSLFAILGKITWDRAFEMIVAYLFGVAIAALFMLIGARIPKKKDRKQD